MLNILEKLISFKSITPKDNGCIDYISELLQNIGFKIYIKEFGKGKNKTKNLYAKYGLEGKNLCFVGHVDVVPEGDLLSWKHDPFKMIIEDDIIYGRGVVDMKGAIACMLHSFSEWVKISKKSVSIILTSDEEGDALYGTKMMLEYLNQIGEKIDFTIVGEPTSENIIGDTVKIGRRGSINFQLKIHGIQGHVAYPEKALNPNRIIIEILSLLSHYKFDNGDDYFSPSNLEITSIDVGNNTLNIIPKTSAANFNIRFNNNYNKESILILINDIISKITKNYDLTYTCNAEPFIIEENKYINDFRETVKIFCKIKPKLSTSGGTSDARFVQKYSPLVEFGLLNSTAHKINESTNLHDLQKLNEIYFEFIKKFHSK